MAKRKEPKAMREWLSKDPTLMSHVHVQPEEAYVRITDRNTVGWRPAGATLTVADCDRKVRLDFSVWGASKRVWEANRKLAYDKLDKMQKALDYTRKLLDESEFIEEMKDES